MKERTQAHLAFAHALARAADTVEVFTIGTRLTRITRALRLRNREQALATASLLVADWDGGTRIGEALDAFLAIPRFSALARGAAVVVLSDGLERGDPAAMVDAVARFSRLAWRIVWLTPLAADSGFEPRTAGLVAARPFLDELGNGGSIEQHLTSPMFLILLCPCPRSRPREGGMTAIVDAHHHIWRRADLPWLDGPMQPRIFGPYEPIRRDYPISEYLADIAGCEVTRSVYVQANWAKDGFEDEVAYVQRAADETGFPQGIVGYADFLPMTCVRSSTG